MVLFFTHIPFVVNHTINATPPERLQHYYIDYSSLPNFFLFERIFQIKPRHPTGLKKQIWVEKPGNGSPVYEAHFFFGCEEGKFFQMSKQHTTKTS